jgi:hypothetical protein
MEYEMRIQIGYRLAVAALTFLIAQSPTFAQVKTQTKNASPAGEWISDVERPSSAKAKAPNTIKGSKAGPQPCDCTNCSADHCQPKKGGSFFRAIGKPVGGVF